MSIFKNNPENNKKNVIRDGVHIKRNRRLIAIGLGLTVATIVGIVLLVTITPRDLGEVEVVAPPVTTVDPALQPLITLPPVEETQWEDLTDEEQEAFLEENSFTQDEVYTEESWDIMLDEHCSDGHCDAEHLAQHHADGQVEEVVETTVPATTVPAVTETTIPTTETTAPPVTTPPTTTVAPAPTTTAPPADPVEECIEDYQGCLSDAVHSYMDAAWTIAPINPSFAVNYLGDTGWAGPCMGSECTFVSSLRERVWTVSDLSFADFTTFADNFCPGQSTTSLDGNSYWAQCNSGHPAGGSFEVKWDGYVLSVKWNIGVASAPGYDSWSNWYRGTH